MDSPAAHKGTNSDGTDPAGTKRSERVAVVSLGLVAEY
jgi:hypothetical protein